MSEELLGSEMVEKINDMEKKKNCFIVSFGDYFNEKWCPAIILFYRYVNYIPPLIYLIMIFRINWNNNDWYWLKKQCPNNVKYWKHNSQMLQRVNDVDKRINRFPQIFFNEVGTLEEIIDDVVVFSAYGLNGVEWNANMVTGRRLIEELPERSKEAQDGSQDLQFVIKNVAGYRKDKALQL